MPLSDVIRHGRSNLTNQQIADLALEADRAARSAATRKGGLMDSLHYLDERDALCELLNDPVARAS